MNELTKEKMMTTKEVAKALGVSVDSVQNAAKALQATSDDFPKFTQGQRAVYNESQATAIKLELQNHSNNLTNSQVQLVSSAQTALTPATTEIEENEIMSVNTIADILGYDSEYLRKKCTELGFTRNGKKTMLNAEQVTILKNALVPRTSDMKIRGQNSITHLEMMQNIQRDMQWLISYNTALQAENERQKAKIAEDAPKVEFFNAVSESADCIDIGECAKILNIKGIGRNKLFEILREKKILRENNQPYQKYVDCGFFRIIETSFILSDGTQKINLKTVVFQKGLDFIRKVITK